MSTTLPSLLATVRRRRRMKHVLRGVGIALVGAIALFVVAAWVIARVGYAAPAVWAARGVALGGLAVLGIWFVVRPWRAELAHDDERIAMYLEEREPSLDAAVVTAAGGGAGGMSGERSARLHQLLVEHAVERVRRIGGAQRVDDRELKRSGGALAVLAALALGTALLGPATLRHGLRLLLTPWDREQPLALYAISADPGNVTVARGGDLLVAAKLQGFQSDAVDLVVRHRDSTSWMRLTMALDSAGHWAGRYTFRLFDIAAPMEYAIESNGVRSPVYRIDVADVPYTKSLALDYRFPAYSGLAPQRVAEGTDIAALKGTDVRLTITTTVPATGGRLIVERGDRADTTALALAADGTLGGTLRVDTAGFYKIELAARDGRFFPGSLEYTVDALPDRPPTVHFAKPGSDQKVLNVDEVYTEAQAEDDYGIGRLELVYSVNGGAERTVPLYAASGGRPAPTMSAGHTFMLEELHLQPGDVVSYYARATDNDAVSGAKTATSDIYFLQVRPFAQDYEQEQSSGAPGGKGGDDAGQLSQRQRELIAGTFNTARDRATTAPKDLEENLATLRIGQQKLRDDVNELARRIVARGVAARDSDFATIAKILAGVAPVMDSAAARLGERDAKGALPPEQRALQQLQHAEAVFRKVRVSMGGAGGGAGAGSGPRAQDLADLFELNREKLRNQYESVQRGSDAQAQRDQQLDETVEKLRKLAARQEQENERAQRKMDSLAAQQRVGSSGSSGGASQRQLAQTAEETARQLERLAREQRQQERQSGGAPSSSRSSSSARGASGASGESGESGVSSARQQEAMEAAARRLRDAADAMRRSASGSTSQQQALADANRALAALRDAQQTLEGQQGGRLKRDVDDALRKARSLGADQRALAGAVNGMWNEPDAQKRGLEVQDLLDRKSQLAAGVRDLKTTLDRLSLDARRENRAASSGLADASQAMRDRKTEEKIRASQSTMRYANPDYSKGLESSIGADLDDVAQRLAQVAGIAGKQDAPADAQKSAAALERARQLVQGMESLDQRAQNGQQSGQRDGQQRGRSAAGLQGGGQPGMGPAGGRAGSGPPGTPRESLGADAEQQRQQLAREMRERLSDARTLERDLAKQGIDTRELGRAIAGMQSLSNERVLGDERAAAALRAQTVESLKAFEFALRKALGASDAQRVLTGRQGDVPAAFRQYVEEYYRSLAKP